MHNPAQLYLASKSPRRRELLSQWGLNFEVLLNQTDDVSEEPLANEEPIDYATRVAAEKALSVDSYIQTAGMTRLPVLASDTIVELDGEILRKPVDKADAFKTLKKLSGKTHRVISSVAVIDKNRKLLQDTSISQVQFRELSADQIQEYIATGEPMDKAGAYAIQGGAAKFVKSFNGSYSGIVGLPKLVTFSLLQNCGITLLG